MRIPLRPNLPLIARVHLEESVDDDLELPERLLGKVKYQTWFTA
jgi:hypothetical protein